MYPVEQNILNLVQATQRNLRRGVLPRHVQPELPFYMSEQSLRRYMARMSMQGDIIRVGGTGARRGYRLPTLIEKVSYAVTGMFPLGAEEIAVN